MMFQGDRVTHTLSTGPPPSFSSCAGRTMFAADRAGVCTLERLPSASLEDGRRGGQQPPALSWGGGYPSDGWQAESPWGPLSPTVAGISCGPTPWDPADTLPQGPCSQGWGLVRTP